MGPHRCSVRSTSRSTSQLPGTVDVLFAGEKTSESPARNVPVSTRPAMMPAVIKT